MLDLLNNEDVKVPIIIGLNLILSLGTVFFHTSASTTVHHVTRAMLKRLRRAPTIFDETLIVSCVVMILSMFHLLEVALWAFAYFILDATSNAQDAFYYSLTTYTTLGPTGVDFDQRLRALAGLESLVGPLMIAWSTASVSAVLTRIAELKPT